MSKSPLLGYNNNIPYQGRVYHVQTEDSGSKRPHVITHLFADGGRIVNTTKTSYAHFVGADNMAEKVRALMREQHRAMVVSLREGTFDELIDPASSSPGHISEHDDLSDVETAQPPLVEDDIEEDPAGRFGAADTMPPQAPPAFPKDRRQSDARGDGAGAYKQIVGRAATPAATTSPAGKSRTVRPPPRRMVPTRPHAQPRPGGGALFGHAVRAQHSVPPGGRAIEDHDEPFGQRYISDLSFDEVVSAFFDAM